MIYIQKKKKKKMREKNMQNQLMEHIDVFRH